MSRRIDFRSTSPYPADEVYAAMVDPAYLLARLDRIGGPGAGLLEHTADAEGVRYRLRQGLAAKDLPSVVRRVLSGDVTIERVESWTRHGAGRHAAAVQVTISGTPASAEGGMRLSDTRDGGSELHVRADVTVRVPLFGGKIEGVVAEQVQHLLAAESAFTREWLARGR